MPDPAKPDDAWRSPHRLAEDLGADSEPHWSDPHHGRSRTFRDTDPDDGVPEDSRSGARMLARLCVSVLLVVGALVVASFVARAVA